MRAATTPQVPSATSTFPIIHFVFRDQNFARALFSIFLETILKKCLCKFFAGANKVYHVNVEVVNSLLFDGYKSSELGNSAQASTSDWLSFERMKYSRVGSSCKENLLGKKLQSKHELNPHPHKKKLCKAHFTLCCSDNSSQKQSHFGLERNSGMGCETQSANFKNYPDLFTPADVCKRELLCGRECVDVNFSPLPLFCNVYQLEDVVHMLSTEIINFVRPKKRTINPGTFVEKMSTTTCHNC